MVTLLLSTGLDLFFEAVSFSFVAFPRLVGGSGETDLARARFAFLSLTSSGETDLARGFFPRVTATGEHSTELDFALRRLLDVPVFFLGRLDGLSSLSDSE
jgi:hypothetical protein